MAAGETFRLTRSLRHFLDNPPPVGAEATIEPCKELTGDWVYVFTRRADSPGECVFPMRRDHFLQHFTPEEEPE